MKLKEMLLDGRKKKGGVKMNRGRKDGNEMKNHEGYYDPTAERRSGGRLVIKEEKA